MFWCLTCYCLAINSVVSLVEYGLLSAPFSQNSIWCCGHGPSGNDSICCSFSSLGGSDPLGPFDASVIPDVEEYLFHRCIKRDIVLKLTWAKVDPWPRPVIVVAFPNPTTSAFPRCLLLLPLSFVGL